MSEGDLKDFMAALAMQALLQRPGGFGYKGGAEDVALEAYKVAEAMMDERARQQR